MYKPSPLKTVPPLLTSRDFENGSLSLQDNGSKSFRRTELLGRSFSTSTSGARRSKAVNGIHPHISTPGKMTHSSTVKSTFGRSSSSTSRSSSFSSGSSSSSGGSSSRRKADKRMNGRNLRSGSRIDCGRQLEYSSGAANRPSTFRVGSDGDANNKLHSSPTSVVALDSPIVTSFADLKGRMILRPSGETESHSAPTSSLPAPPVYIVSHPAVTLSFDGTPMPATTAPTPAVISAVALAASAPESRPLLPPPPAAASTVPTHIPAMGKERFDQEGLVGGGGCFTDPGPIDPSSHPSDPSIVPSDSETKERQSLAARGLGDLGLLVTPKLTDSVSAAILQGYRSCDVTGRGCGRGVPVSSEPPNVAQLEPEPELGLAAQSLSLADFGPPPKPVDSATILAEDVDALMKGFAAVIESACRQL
jgi:hypothetical protein